MLPRKALAAFFIATCSAAATAEPGAFFGASLVRSQFDIHADDVDDGSFTSSSVDNSDTGFQLRGGYNFNDNVGFEVSYTDGGTARIDAVTSGGPIYLIPGPVQETFDITGVAFGLNGYAPINDKLYGIGRFGIMMWTVDATVTMGGLSGSASDDGNDPFFGLGIGFRAGRTGIELGWTRYNVEDSNADGLSLGLVLRPKSGN